MTSPATAQDTTGGRFYRHPQTGETWPSVTNILSRALAKPALIGWAARETANAAVEWMAGHPDPTQLQTALADPANKGEAVRWLKGRPYAKRDAAADLGSRVHDLIEGHTLGEVADGAEPDELAMLEQYLAFHTDCHPLYEASEATVVNRAIGYAGTLDCIARIPQLGDGLHVVDFKTGRTGPYPEWALQLAAYAGAEVVLLPDGTELPMPPITGAAALRVRPRSWSLHPVTANLRDLLDVFEHAVSVSAFKDAPDPFNRQDT